MNNKDTMDRDFKMIGSILTGGESDEILALAKYVHQERVQALGWAHAEACTQLDRNEDIRKQNVPVYLDRALNDLELVPSREDSTQ